MAPGIFFPEAVRGKLNSIKHIYIYFSNRNADVSGNLCQGAGFQSVGNPCVHMSVVQLP